MHTRTYLALDLETTGLDAKADAILEIAALRFEIAAGVSPRIVERFVTLVNPQRAIPLRIQQITGIRQADVVTAPTLDRLLPELRALVSGQVSAIVAHNPAFDLGFLRANGLHFACPAIDTFELAAIVLPRQASYNLGELCHALDIPLTDAHRAAADAEATAQLFCALLDRLAQLPPPLLQTIAARSAESDWSLAPLFAQASAAVGTLWPQAQLSSWRALLASARSGWREHNDNETGVTPLVAVQGAYDPVPNALLEDFFAADGPLAQQLGERYEARHGQVSMAQQALSALNRGDHLMIEAGTGVGKSLAYLLPAALWSVHNQRRVLIATHTIPLQEQLLDKDIPQVQALLRQTGRTPPSAALLKGRSNYLCLRRLQDWCNGRRLSAVELSVLARILAWLPATSSGEVSELALLTPAERAVWDHIASDAATCSPERCFTPPSPDVESAGLRADLYLQEAPAFDFYYLALQRAEQAHLLIVNHALLLADIAAGGRVLPPCQHLIIDEAHHLEEAATEQMTYRVDWSWVQALLKRLGAEGDLLPAILSAAARFQLLPVQNPATLAVRQASRCASVLARFAQLLLHFARQHEDLRAESGYAQRLALDGRIRTQPQWSEIEIEWDAAAEQLRLLLDHCQQLCAVLEAAHWAGAEPTALLYREFAAALQQLSELTDQLDRMILAPQGVGRGLVAWLEVNETAASVQAACAPLYVGDLLEKEIVHAKRSVIFTSATLRASESFAFIRERLGAWDVNTAVVASPFDYEQSALLYLPSDLAMPNHPNYQPALERALIDAAQASEGRTLALFTSYAHLRATAEGIRAPLDRLGITVLQHGVSSRQRLLRQYRASERAILLGTRSFWEGVDLPGDELLCLAIVRLPFAVPNDPLVAARSAEFDDPFHDYTLPDAILRFRQGFGRLIRRASDRGVVVLLDSRAWCKEYGQVFLESLPTCTVHRAPLANLAGEIQHWLAGNLRSPVRRRH